MESFSINLEGSINEEKEASSARWLLAILFCILTIFVFFGMLLIGKGSTIYIPAWFDQYYTHIPQINYFISHPFNFLHYPVKSATLPGHHIFLAYVASALGINELSQDTWALRIVNALVAYALLIAAWSLIWKLCKNAWRTFILVLPITCSYYTISAAIWINTDNGAMFFYTMLLYCLLEENPNALLTMGYTFFMVLWRQIYLPVIGAFWLPVIFSKNSYSSLKFAVIGSFPALILVAGYAATWGGLTAPIANNPSKLILLSPTLLLHAFSLFGLLVIPYMPFFYSDKYTRVFDRKLFIAITISVIVAITLWLISPSTYYDPNEGRAGRYGSLVWLIANFTPFLSIDDKSFSVLILTLIGTFVLSMMILRAIRLRYYPIEIAMLLFYFIGYSCQQFPYQRYLEPIVLVTYAVYGARIIPISNRKPLGPLFYLLYCSMTLGYLWVMNTI